MYRSTDFLDKLITESVVILERKTANTRLTKEKIEVTNLALRRYFDLSDLSVLPS